MNTHYKLQKPDKENNMPKSGSSFGDFLPLKEMEIGDRFTISQSDLQRVRRNLDAYGAKNGTSYFLCMGEDHHTVYRVS